MPRLFLFLVSFLPLLVSAAPLAVTNHKSGDALRYQVALVRGTLEEGATSLKITNASLPKGFDPAVPVISGSEFKALVPLSIGANELTLKSDRSEQPVKFTLNFKAQSNPYFVRLVYLTDNSGDKTYAAPDPKATQDHLSRMRTCALIMQTFTAEKMNELGFGHRTFGLERDKDGQVIVNDLKGAWEKEYYYKLGDSGQYWGQVRSEVDKAFPSKFTKNVVLAAFTRKNPETGKMLGHTALGGMNLGLFGSASIFSWPEKLSEVPAAFLNEAKVDPKNVHDDSAGRHTYWGLASTTIGATLHELTHTFGVIHTDDRRGIMSRGFDQFNRTFTFEDPKMARRGAVKFTRQQEAYFCPDFASYLSGSRWFSLDSIVYPDSNRPVTRLNKELGTVELRATSGIRWVGFYKSGPYGEVIGTYRLIKGDNPVRSQTFKIAEIEKEMKGAKIARIDTLGANGISSQFTMPKS